MKFEIEVTNIPEMKACVLTDEEKVPVIKKYYRFGKVFSL